MFRKAIVVLALIAASALFFGVAAPAANAGNCTAITFNTQGHPNDIWYDGQWVYNPVVGACTGVSAIEFKAWYSSGAGIPPFIYDFTRAAYHNPYSGGGTCYAGPGPTLPSCNTYYHNYTWGQGCGYPAFYVGAYYQYRIRSYPGQTWGDWHSVWDQGQYIC